MIGRGTWISRNEEVALVNEKKNFRNGKYMDEHFMARSKEGNLVFIPRGDILFDEEMLLIDELVSILRRYPNPARSDRYSLILKVLMKQGAPFYQPLKQRMTKTKEQLLLDL
jgi:hypothetical protein